MPAIGEGVFWLTGELSSVLPVFGTIILMGWLISHSEEPTRGIHYAAAAGTAVLLTGLHEMFALILCILLATGALATVSSGHKDRRLWFVAFAAALLGFAIVSLAPGNRARAAIYFAGAPYASWPQVLSDGLRNILYYVIKTWFLDIKLLAATIFFVWHPVVRHLRPTWVYEFGLQARRSVLLGWILTTTLPFVLPGLMVSRIFYLPGRTLDGLYAVFLFGWFLTVFVFTRSINDHPQDELRLGTWSHSLAAVVLALSLLRADNSMTMYRDLRSNVAPWRAAMTNRLLTLQAARKQNQLDVVVPSLAPVIPVTFFYQDAQADPKYFCNICIAQYFGLKTVTAHSPDSRAATLQ
jgi:hypothetical protein